MAVEKNDGDVMRGGYCIVTRYKRSKIDLYYFHGHTFAMPILPLHQNVANLFYYTKGWVSKLATICTAGHLALPLATFPHAITIAHRRSYADDHH